MCAVRARSSPKREDVLLQDVSHAVAHALVHAVNPERLADATNYCSKYLVSKFFRHS